MSKKVADFSPASASQTLGKNRPWSEIHGAVLGDGTGRTKQIAAIFDFIDAPPAPPPEPEPEPEPTPEPEPVEVKPETTFFVTMSKTGTVFTVHSFTLPTPLPPVLILQAAAPADYVKGDTLIVNGRAVPLADAANNPLSDNAWKLGGGIELMYFTGTNKAFFKTGAPGSAKGWNIFPGVTPTAASEAGLYIPTAVPPSLIRINGDSSALGRKILKIAAGSEHIVILLEGGEVYTAGLNQDGQLCRVTPNGSLTVPNLGKVEGIPPIKDIAAGWAHTLLVSMDGIPYSAGNNDHGQCGHNGASGSRTVSNLTPVALGLVSRVAAGRFHSAFALSTGGVYTAGNNDNGQLGRPGETGLGRVTSLTSSVQSVSCGSRTTYFHMTNNDVCNCGDNTYGQLGRVTAENAVPTPDKVYGLPHPVRSVEAGGETAAFVLTNNDVYTCGNNRYGQLGREDVSGTKTNANLSFTLSGILTADVGDETVAFLQTNGVVWTAGNNSYGQLGRATTSPSVCNPSNVSPVSAASAVSCGYQSLYVAAALGLYTAGYNIYGQLARAVESGGSSKVNLGCIGHETFGLPEAVAAEDTLTIIPGAMSADPGDHIALYHDEAISLRLPVYKVYQTRGGKILELPFSCKGNA